MRPMQRHHDALMDFKADLIVISTHPEKRSRWLRHGLVEQARHRFGVPVIHVVSTAAPFRTERRAGRAYTTGAAVE